MNTEKIIARVNQLIDLGQKVAATRRQPHRGSSYTTVDEGLIKGFRSATLSFIEQIYGNSHTHYTEFGNSVEGRDINDLNAGIAILNAIKSEIEGGWLNTIKGLISAEIFADFLEMAEHLLENNYKDPAAVMIGSVLEEHLRQLCMKTGIEVEVETEKGMRPKKADLINAELSKAEVYNKLDQKAITSWLELRNKAAHGNYNEYSQEQVSLMLQGVSDFMRRVSA